MMNRMLTAVFALLVAGVAHAQAPPQPATPASPPDQSNPAQAEKKPVYDESADAHKQLEAALKSARKENRRVLIQWGANWCGWCIKLHDTMNADKELARKLLYEYEILHIDIGKWDKHFDLAEKFGVDLKANGVPYLTILDADGNVLANQETSSLEAEGYEFGGPGPSHDARKVKDFLTRHQAPYLEAEDLLKESLAVAKEEEKTVLLHFGAPWCGWCHKFEAWLALPEVEKALAKDFVLLKIDTDRAHGGKEMLQHYAKRDNTGIPWFVLLDAGGEVIATSDDASGQNIGCPATEEEIAHFRAILTKSAKRLTKDDIEKITALLKQKDERTAAAGH